MKWTTLVLSCFIFSFAHAETINPVGQAKAVVLMVKNVGSQQEIICKKEVDVPVFDMRGVVPVRFNPGIAQCPTTIYGKDVMAMVETNITLENFSYDFDSSNRIDVKRIHSYLTFHSNDYRNVPGLQNPIHQSFTTPDLKLNSGGFELSPEFQKQEYVTASVRVRD